LFPHFATHHLWWLAVGGAGVAVRLARLRTKPAPLLEFESYPTTVDLLEQQSVNGYNAHSLVSISAATRHWSCPQVEGSITYNEFGKVWLVPGDPLAHPDNVLELTRRFVAAAKEEGRFPAFLPATARFAGQIAPLRLHSVKIAAAPYFDLSSWTTRGDRAKKVRAGVNQARRAGLSVQAIKVVDESLEREVARLCRSWLQSRRCAVKLGWLFELNPFQHAERKKFFTARDMAGRLVGFLAASPIPAREGWYLEDVLRLPTAPPGTAELLIVEALATLRSEGWRLATLGTSPLARDGEREPNICHHQLVESILRIVTSSFSGFYNFEGLRRFKTKFAPSRWESEYLILPREALATPRLIRAFVQAIAPGGASNLIVSQLLRALKGAAPEAQPAPNFETSGPLPGASAGKAISNKRVNMNQEYLRDKADRSAHLTSNYKTARAYFGQFITVEELRFHYVSRGSGRPVVFIHGNPGSHHDFSNQVLDGLAENYRTVFIDRPGHGLSERGERSLNVEDQARLLCDVLKRISVERPIIVGHSWGGAVALAMALEAQEELAGLVLLAPAAFPGDSPGWWTTLPNFPLLGSVFLKTLTPLIGSRIVRSSLTEAYYPQQIQDDYLKAAETLWTKPSRIKACASDDRSLERSLELLSPRYVEIQLPVVIVTGDTDRVVNPEKNAQCLAHSISGAHLIRLTNTGHQLPQTRPQTVIEAIEMIWEIEVRQESPALISAGS
jgi:pimeloyl-ACP methyl ester carboxylesterase